MKFILVLISSSMILSACNTITPEKMLFDSYLSNPEESQSFVDEMGKLELEYKILYQNH